MLDLIPKIKLINMTIFIHLSGKYTDFLDWVRGAYAEIGPIFKKYRGTFGLVVGGGWVPSQNFGHFPKVWPI